MREARKRPLAERSTFLDGASAGDDALRGGMEAVLASSATGDTPLPQETEVALLFRLWRRSVPPCSAPPLVRLTP